MIHTEQIAASNAFLLISPLPHVSDDLSRKKRERPKRVVYFYRFSNTPGNYPVQAESPCVKACLRHLLREMLTLRVCFWALSLVSICLTCLMTWPTYSITISSAAIGSMANSPQSWMWLRLKRILFFRNWYKKLQRVSCQKETNWKYPTQAPCDANSDMTVN